MCLSCQPLVHLRALEVPQEVEVPLQPVQPVGLGLEREETRSMTLRRFLDGFFQPGFIFRSDMYISSEVSDSSEVHSRWAGVYFSAIHFNCLTDKKG